MPQLIHLTTSLFGTFVVLSLAAYLEVQGDACFQSGLYHAAGRKQMAWFVTGAAVLVCYSLLLNSSRIDFGKLLGIYVALFYVVAQLVAKLQFHQSPGRAAYLGGSLIVAGGLVVTFWKG